MIQKVPPKEPNIIKMVELGESFKDELAHLNDDQRLAVLKCALADNFQMVLGTAGSGKTLVTITLIKILAALKKKILLISPALDHFLLRLKQANFTSFLRVAAGASGDPLLQAHTKNYEEFENMEQIRELIESTLVFGTTAPKICDDLLLSVKFDFCIVDRASQICEPMILGALMKAEHFVMIGDYYQSNP